MKNKWFRVLEVEEDTSLLSRWVNGLILGLIGVNILSIVLESFATLYARYQLLFTWIEMISVIIFTVEYIFRLYVSDLKYNSGPVRSRVKHVFSLMALIDLFAILPFYLPFIGFDLRFIRIFRLTRIFRLFKLNRYSKAMRLIQEVMRDKKEPLVATVWLMFFIILFSSTLMYYVETDHQPDLFPNIVATFWWAIATLTTVGYGDIYPVTVMGKVIASVIAVAGIGLVALPTGIISSGFLEKIEKSKAAPSLRCPHCQEYLEQPYEQPKTTPNK